MQMQADSGAPGAVTGGAGPTDRTDRTDRDGLAFAGAPAGSFDRAAALRGDAAAQARFWQDPASRVLPVWQGKVLARTGPASLQAAGQLVAVAPDHPALTLAPGGTRFFLGLAGGRALLAQDLSAWRPEGQAEAPPGGLFDRGELAHPALPDGSRFVELRALMSALPALEGELAAMVRALAGWHAAHGFCARCGAASVPVEAGWQRRCPACGAEHFPRTDPVVIMLVTRGNRLLLGRSPGWPEGMYSCLAGFVEPGETVEAAVRREVAEETGVPVGAVRYVASQPWPFPASLMLGCRAEALAETIVLDPAEIEDAFWLGREELARAFDGRHPKMRPPRAGAIAAHLMQLWLQDRLE